MRRHGYLWTSAVNLDTGVPFADPDFLLECKLSAIRRRFPLIFAFYIFLHFNSHQVWSWYVHTLPSYSVFVCWYVTWPCDLDLCHFDIEQGHSWRVTCPTLLPSMKTLCLSVVELRVITFPTGYHWKTITFLESPTLICIFTVQLQWLYDEYN